MTGQIVFIVWRESVEALLVIGILNAWLRQNAQGTGAARYLWSGVGAGGALALVIAYAISNLATVLPPDALDYFMVAMMLIATTLIVQMVFWMRAHGRSLKQNLERGLGSALARKRWWGIFLLALIAVAREGSETVIFVYGLLSSASDGASDGGLFHVSGAIALGLAIAMATYGALQLGGRYISWRVFFRFTEVMLLLLGSALAVNAADKLIALGVLPFTPVVWDSRWLLDDGTRLGGVVSALTGYRAAPDQVILAVWGIYWGVVIGVGNFRSILRRVRAAHT